MSYLSNVSYVTDTVILTYKNEIPQIRPIESMICKGFEGSVRRMQKRTFAITMIVVLKYWNKKLFVAKPPRKPSLGISLQGPVLRNLAIPKIEENVDVLIAIKPRMVLNVELLKYVELKTLGSFTCNANNIMD